MNVHPDLELLQLCRKARVTFAGIVSRADTPDRLFFVPRKGSLAGCLLEVNYYDGTTDHFDIMAAIRAAAEKKDRRRKFGTVPSAAPGRC